MVVLGRLGGFGVLRCIVVVSEVFLGFSGWCGFDAI